MKKYFSVLLMLLCAHLLSAQSLVINGYIVIDDDSSEGTRITIYKNNEKLEEKSIPKKGKFDLKFGWDADYKLSFEKPGYITKIVSINTDIPPEIVETNPNFPPVKLIINLLPLVEGVDLSIFEQPIAILSYNYELDDFTFDKEYSSKIKDKIAQTEQKVRTELTQRGAAAREKERLFAEWSNKGQVYFTDKKWQDAIAAWTEALKIKTDAKDIKDKIEIARKENELEIARKAVEAQNARSYQLLISSADSLFRLKNYNNAREKYVAARAIKSTEDYPIRQIGEIDKLLTELAQAEKAAAEQKALQEKYKGLIVIADQAMQQKNYDEAESKYKEALALNFEKEYPENQLKDIAGIKMQNIERQKLETELNNRYNKIIAEADNHFSNKTYEKALEGYRQANQTKPVETYPKEMITKTENAIVLLEQQKAAEAEKRQKEEQKKAELMDKYNKIIVDADVAFKGENYAIARTRYLEAAQLNTGLNYPQDQIKAIDGILNSTKYQQKLAEYNKNKEMAEKAAAVKNYASAKFYYQKAKDILPIDKENIEKLIAEIDQLIEAEHLAAIEKAYKEQIEKADQALQEKSYAIAKFYYQKALEIKKDDQYAKGRLVEVEKNIGERTEKTIEL